MTAVTTLGVLFLFSFSLAIVSVSNDEAVNRFNAYLTSSRSAATMGIERGEVRDGGADKKVKEPPLSDIGKCVPFTLDMHTWSDEEMVAARINWGQLQNLIGRCGNEYSEDWCVSVVAHIKNSIGYRELELAVLHAGNKRYGTNRQQQRQFDSEDEEDDGGGGENKENEDTSNSMAVYTRTVRKYLDRIKRDEKKTEPIKIQ